MVIILENWFGFAILTSADGLILDSGSNLSLFSRGLTLAKYAKPITE
jgi:hypothetical protein